MTSRETSGAGRGGRVLAAEVLVLGRRDAVVVLGLRVLRRGSLLVIPLGATVAVLAGTSEERLGAQFDTVSGWLHSLLSPLWLLAIGILLRLAVAPLAYLVAVGVAVSGPCDVRQRPDRRTSWSRLTDLFRVAGGLRALRWTRSARDVAVALSGGLGRVLDRVERLLGWAICLAWATFAAVAAVTDG